MGVGALFGVLLTKLLSDNLARYIATKAVLITLFVGVLPVILNNFVYSLLQIAMDYASNLNGQADSLPQIALQLTGLAGWFFSNLYLPDALSVIFSAISIRVFLNHIPFLRL